MRSTSSLYGSAGMRPKRDGEVSPFAKIPGSIYARITYVNWEQRTINCIGMANQKSAGPWNNVPVLSTMATQSEGLHWLPTITEVDVEYAQQAAEFSGVLDALAVIDFIGGDPLRPICMGFVSAGPNEFSFNEPGTRIDRHASNVYSRLAQNGTYEFSFADGTFVKISPASEGYGLTDLDAKNTKHAGARPWNIPTDQPRIISFSHPSGTSITIDENGSINIVSATSISITSKSGRISLNTPSESFSVG